MNTEFIINKAQNIIKTTGGRNPYFAAKQSGVSVNFKDLGSLKGAYLGNMPIPAIIINPNISPQMQQIICAHELGHHFLHKGSVQGCYDNSVSIYEREANLFAAEFLLDKKNITELLTESYSVTQVATILETDVNLVLLLLSTDGITEVPESTFLRKEEKYQLWQSD